MDFSKKFICASERKNEYDAHVCAPLFKRVFSLEKIVASCVLQICGLGFYRLFLNGEEITKGKFAPYISNTDEAVYYDEYSVEKYLRIGENVLTVLLGNGWQNPIGGEVWWLDKASWLSAPKLAIKLSIGGKTIFEADEQFSVAPSPITFDDFWSGEHYDARAELCPKKWRPAVKTEEPKGEKRLADFAAIRVKREVKPIDVFPYENGYVYDFGINTAGICRLHLQGVAGQKISLYHFEIFQNGAICKENISFGKRTRKDYWQQDEYICKDGENIYEPSFTYHGFRYVYVEGLESAQATKETLTMLVLSTNARQKLEFSCSDKRVERLVDNVLNSNFSNFFYFPTDCPQREKNGWTGDAMLSAEQMLLSMNVSELLKEWLVNMRKSQKENGALPRIVPTGEWGYKSGESGPNWDGALIELPYRIYELENDRNVIVENLPAVQKYLWFLSQMRNDSGVLEFGLGDREQTFSSESSAHETPNYITDTLTAISLCEKTARMARVIKDTEIEEYANTLKESLIFDFRKHYIDENCRVRPYTQTGQCLALFAGIFSETERDKAFEALIDLIEKNNGKLCMGVIGYRYFFDVMATNGRTEEAYKKLINEDYTGYLYYVKKGMTSMIESFVAFQDNNYQRLDGGKIPSLNHHWYGHILGALIKYIVGIRVCNYDAHWVEISPTFIKDLEWISVKTEILGKDIAVQWQRREKEMLLTVETALCYKLGGLTDMVAKKKCISDLKTEYYFKLSEL